jgi:hypothetical protein
VVNSGAPQALNDQLRARREARAMPVFWRLFDSIVSSNFSVLLFVVESFEVLDNVLEAISMRVAGCHALSSRVQRAFARRFWMGAVRGHTSSHGLRNSRSRYKRTWCYKDLR